MRAPTLLLSISIALGVLACQNATGPTRIQRSISSITVPVSAAAADTIRIRFAVDAGGCDTGVIVESQLMSDSMRFSASSVPFTGVCDISATTRFYSYIVAPFHALPFTVSFAEPGQADNVFGVVAP
jgi:hypothetical protein